MQAHFEKSLNRIMKQLFILITILLFTLAGSNTFGQATDSLQATISPSVTDSMVVANQPLTAEVADDFAPFLALVALGAIACMLVFVGAGIVLMVVALLLLFGLVSFSIISTSFMVGLHRKSFAKGFKTFVVLASTASGILLCGVGAFVFNQIVHWWPSSTAVIIGVCSGLVAGLILGWVANRMLQRLTTYFKQKLNLTEGNSFPSA
jgi:hypothetical protein